MACKVVSVSGAAERQPGTPASSTARISEAEENIDFLCGQSPAAFGGFSPMEHLSAETVNLID
jgi:hypothetical protein